MLEIEKQSIDNKLVAGTRWEIRESSVNYNPDDYKLVYIFTSQGGIKKEYTTVKDNNTHLLLVNPDQTSSFASGYYNVSISAKSLTDENKIYPVANVYVYVLDDGGGAGKYYIQMVSKLEKTILSLASKTMSSVNLDGVTYTYNDIEKLERMLNYYRDKAGVNKKNSNKVYISFVS